MYSSSPGFALSVVLAIAIYIAAIVLGIVIFYWLIKKAIRTAMADHYKTVLIYEQTGEWVTGPFAKGPPPVGYYRSQDPGPDQPPAAPPSA